MIRQRAEGRALPRIDSGDALLAFDSELRVVAWNDTFERLTGLAGSSICDRHCWAVLRAVNPDGTPVCEERCSIGCDVIGGRPRATVEVFLGAAGGDRPVLMSTLGAESGTGRVFVHAFHQHEAVSPFAAEQHVVLTPRQQETLRLLGEGLGTREIAARLTLSEQTVKNHIRAVLAGLGCHTRLEAVVKAQRLRLI